MFSDELKRRTENAYKEREEPDIFNLKHMNDEQVCEYLIPFVKRHCLKRSGEGYSFVKFEEIPHLRIIEDTFAILGLLFRRDSSFYSDYGCNQCWTRDWCIHQHGYTISWECTNTFDQYIIDICDLLQTHLPKEISLIITLLL